MATTPAKFGAVTFNNGRAAYTDDKGNPISAEEWYRANGQKDPLSSFVGPSASQGGQSQQSQAGGQPATANSGFFDGYNPPGAGAVPNFANISQVQTNDVDKMATSDRNFAIAQGEGIDAGLRGRADDQGYLEEYYRNAANRAYAPILEGQGGYSPAEQDQIVRDQELQGLAYDPSMTESLQLTGDEQAAIKGDPYKATQWFDPEWNDQIVTSQTANTRGAVNDMTDRKSVV